MTHDSYGSVAGRYRRFSDPDKTIISDLRRNGTKAEDRLWELLRKDQISGVRFRRQHKIGNFIVDFYSIKCRLAIEADGDVHANQVEQDNERAKWLESFGILILRFSNDEILIRPDEVRERIQKAVSERIHLRPT